MPQKIEFKYAKFEQHEMDLLNQYCGRNCAYDDENRNWICFHKSGRYVLPNCSSDRICPLILKLAIYYVDDFGDINAMVDGVSSKIFGHLKHVEDTNNRAILIGITEYESMEHTTILVKNTLYDCNGDIITGNFFSNNELFITRTICRTSKLMILYSLRNGYFVEKWQTYEYFNFYVLDLSNRKLVMEIVNSKIRVGVSFEEFWRHEDPSIRNLASIMNQQVNNDRDVIIRKLFEVISEDTIAYRGHIINVGNSVSKKCKKCEGKFNTYAFAFSGWTITCMNCFGQPEKVNDVAFIYG